MPGSYIFSVYFGFMQRSSRVWLNSYVAFDCVSSLTMFILLQGILATITFAGLFIVSALLCVIVLALLIPRPG